MTLLSDSCFLFEELKTLVLNEISLDVWFVASRQRTSKKRKPFEHSALKQDYLKMIEFKTAFAMAFCCPLIISLTSGDFQVTLGLRTNGATMPSVLARRTILY